MHTSCQSLEGLPACSCECAFDVGRMLAKHMFRISAERAGGAAQMTLQHQCQPSSYADRVAAQARDSDFAPLRQANQSELQLPRNGPLPHINN